MSNLLEAKKKGKQNPWWDDDGDGIGYEQLSWLGNLKERKKWKKQRKLKNGGMMMVMELVP